LANSYDTYDVHDLLNSNNNSHPVASTCNSGTIDLADIVKDLTNAKPIIAGLSDNNSGIWCLLLVKNQMELYCIMIRKLDLKKANHMISFVQMEPFGIGQKI